MSGLIGSGFFLVLIIAVVMVFLHFVPLGLWISALAANVQVNIVGSSLDCVGKMSA